MKNFASLCLVAVVAAAFTGNTANAWDERLPNRIKPVSGQSILAHLAITDIAASTSTTVLASANGDTTGAVTNVTSGFSTWTSPRNLTVTPAGQTADIAAGNVIITGTDYHGNTISETFSFLANATAKSIGTYAFATVSSVSFPAEDSPYLAQWHIGTGTVFGLPRCMDGDNVVMAVFGGTYESTRPTVVSDADEIHKNTFELNSAPDGASELELWFVENYACQP